MLMGLIDDKKPAVSSYIGPGDIVSGASAFWSFRAYNTATVGTKCCRIRDSGGTLHVINSLATGLPDTATITSVLGGNPGTVETMYDQTGNGHDVTQATTASMPPIQLSSGPGGYPCAFPNGGGANTGLASASLTVPQPFSLVAVITNDTNGGAFQSIITDGSENLYVSADTTLNIFAGVNLAQTSTMGVNTPYYVIGIANSTSSDLLLNGVSVASTNNAGTNSFSGAASFMNVTPPNATNVWGGFVCEGAIYPIALNGTQQTNLTTNARSLANGFNF